MDNKAFVFTGFAFLLVVPAIILAGALANMMYYGSTGIAISMVGDEVFYSCQNILGFLDDGSRDGQRDYVLEQAALYASEHSLNFTSTAITTTFFGIVFESPGGLTCNKTVDLRLGTLSLNLTMHDWNSTLGGKGVYFRKDRNNIVNVTGNVTFSNETCASGASVTLDILGLTNQMNETVCGIFTDLTNVTALVDDTDECTRKYILGTKTADASTNLTDWYDGSDSESFFILGDMSGSTVEGLVSGRGASKGLKAMINLADEYGDVVTEYVWPSQAQKLDCNGNFTSSLPNITASIYKTSIIPGNLQATFVAPINITENADGEFITTDPVTGFTSDSDYFAVVSASSADYATFSWQGPITFTDLKAYNVYNESVDGMKLPANKECDIPNQAANGDQGIVLNISNIGTTDDSTIENLSVIYKYCDGSSCDLDDVNTYKPYANGTYDYPTGGPPSGRDQWLVCEFDVGISLESGDRIFANITSVNSAGTLDIDQRLTNNFANWTIT